jgi:hypothetical protein
MAEQPDFAGQVIMVWMKGPSKGGVFENVCIRKIADRTFLVGRVADKGDRKVGDPRVGLTYWLALDEVEMITEYPDVQTARTAYALHEADKAKKKPQGWRFWR